jgi:hypothetical protein
MTQQTERSGKPPVFHGKRAYRLRRLMDAARLAPLLALMLWLLPLFWPQSGDGRISSATALIYIFGVWAGVIALTWSLSRALGKMPENHADADL